jgi:hypothetical protein
VEEAGDLAGVLIWHINTMNRGADETLTTADAC